MQQGLVGSYVPKEQGLGGLAAMMVHSNPELMAKITGGIYKDYDYGADGTADARGHYSDKGKLPNHPTFSDESMYSGDKYRGGVWSTDDRGNYAFKGNDVFTPSADMINSGATRGLWEYFRMREPNATLNMPTQDKRAEEIDSAKKQEYLVDLLSTGPNMSYEEAANSSDMLNGLARSAAYRGLVQEDLPLRNEGLGPLTLVAGATSVGAKELMNKFGDSLHKPVNTGLAALLATEVASDTTVDKLNDNSARRYINEIK